MKKGAARVGIDIGSSSIKLVQVSSSGEKPELSAIGLKSVAGVSSAAFSDTLKLLADESRVSCKDACISISGPSVIVRFISLPKMDEAALKGAIRYEAEKFIPYNISECVVDFQTLRKDDKENKLNILLVAAKKDVVQGRIKLAEKAGFSVSVVDVDSFAVANAFLGNHPKTEPDKSYAILNVGGSFTNLSILKEGSIFFARDIAVGGNNFTAAIAKRFAVDQKAAEEIKLHPPEGKGDEVADCAKIAFSDLLDEIKLSFGYYENQAGKGIDEIYLSGGSAAMPGIEQIFEEAFGSKPVSWNALEFLGKSAPTIDPKLAGAMNGSFAVAVGLALR
ncbi:MAG: type IV pilus assembly protein PilM [Candidatus Omnitrophica bacterium]|nr:type IV pilus assembly protein PilM [Candidatus Omnitrophota bacterium]